MQDLPRPDPRVVLLHDLHETTRFAELGCDSSPPLTAGPSFRSFVGECVHALASVVRERYHQTMLGSGWS